MKDINRPKELRQDFLITSADVDFEGKLSVSSLINMLIQSAWKHAECLGWGSDKMEKKNMSWILSSVQIQLDEYPVWKQEIRCETWPKGINRLFYQRDFRFFNSDNKTIMNATSNWMLIDKISRRPKLYKIDDEILNVNKDRHAIQMNIKPINTDNKFEHIASKEIKYSDIDINNHLTATRYIDFIFDTFSPAQISIKRPVQATFFYMKEVLYDENIKIIGCDTDSKSKIFQIENEKGIISFIAELLF